MGLQRRQEAKVISYPPQLSPEDIARVAHELFMARGGEHGRDLDDWLKAEERLRDDQSAR